MIFTLDSIYRMLRNYELLIIVATTYLFTPFGFLCSLLSSSKKKYIFGFSLTNSLIATPATNLFESSQKFNLNQTFFVFTKIFINICIFNFIHQTVCINNSLQLLQYFIFHNEIHTLILYSNLICTSKHMLVC